MIEINPSELEEYAPDKLVFKKLNEGRQSKAMLMHLLPGQEVPAHPHPSDELMFVPQKGEALLTIDGENSITLKPGRFYFEGHGHSVRIQNIGTEPFQMVVALARVAGE